jgi:hypothetical protein
VFEGLEMIQGPGGEAVLTGPVIDQAALFLPALAILGGGAIYHLLFPSRFDPSMTYAREKLGMIAVGGATDLLPFIIIQTAYAIARSLLDLPYAFGEEFGWRGYLQQKSMPREPAPASRPRRFILDPIRLPGA